MIDDRASGARRVFAFLIDYLLLAVYAAGLSAIAFAFGPDVGASPADFAGKLRGHAIAFATLTAPVVLYFAVLETSPLHGTLGKRVLGLRVEAGNGARLGTARSLVRSAVKFLPWEIAHFAIWYVPGRPFLDPMPTTNIVISLGAIAVAVVYVISALVWRRTPYDLIAGSYVRQRARR
ncbi:MAG: RDD family protein [Pseudomonadota bacterium]